MPERFPQPPKIVGFTGPGLVRESGFAPFDPATMLRGMALEDVVTRDGFARDPSLVHDFYNARRRELHAAQPNCAYEGLAALELTRPGEVLIVARNIDDLHERAGAQAVIHTHGELLKARCTICTKVSRLVRRPQRERPLPDLRQSRASAATYCLGRRRAAAGRYGLHGVVDLRDISVDRQCLRWRAGPFISRRRQAGRRSHDRILPAIRIHSRPSLMSAFTVPRRRRDGVG
jgi:hypothetical protein